MKEKEIKAADAQKPKDKVPERPEGFGQFS